MRPPSLSVPPLATASPDAEVEAAFLSVLPWLATRYDSVVGSFRGEGSEAETSHSVLTAQAAGTLNALGLYNRLPHVVRAKLASWPTVSEAALVATAAESALARSLRPALGKSPTELNSVLAAFASQDFGYALDRAPLLVGSVAAAHYLITEARPTWYRLHARPIPRVSEEAISHFIERLLPSFAP
jgi:hypothetical protein